MYYFRFLFLFIFLLIQLAYSCTNPEPKKKASSKVDSLISSKVALAEKEIITSKNYNKAIEILRAILISDTFNLAADTSKSKVFHKLGSYSYQAVENEQALPYLDNAIRLRNLDDTKHSAVDIANSYYIRSLVYEKLKQYKPASEDISDAITIAVENQFDEHTLGVYYSKAAHFFLNIGELNITEEYLEQASKKLLDDSKEKGEYFNHYGEYYSVKGEREKAIEEYKKGIAIFYKLPGEENNLFSLRFNLMIMALYNPDFKGTEQLHLDFLKEINATDNHLKNLKRQGHANLGYYYLRENKFKNAKDQYNNALEVAVELSNSNNSVNIALAYEGLGDVDLKNKNFEKAIQSYHKAIEALCIDFDTKDAYALPSIQDHVIINVQHLERILDFKADAVYGKYQQTQRLSDLNSAFKTYKVLDELLVQIRQGYKAALSRFDLVEKTLPIYEKATEVALELFERTKEEQYLREAFFFATKNKAIVLLDGLQDEQAKFAGIPENLLKEENKLKSSIYKLEGEIFDLNNAKNKTKELSKKIDERFNATREYESLINGFEKEYPRYFQLKYANKNAVNIDDLIDRLPDSAAIIEYFIGKKNTYVFSISSKSGLQYSSFKTSSDLKKECLTFRQLIEKDSLGNLAEFSRVSYSLYNKLLKQTLEKIEEKEKITRLFIIPDDYLMQLSFDPILTEKPDTNELKEWIDKQAILLNKYAISFCYTNLLLFNQSSQSRVHKAMNQYVGFGLEYDDYTLEAIKKHQFIKLDSTLVRGMGKLTYSDDEVRESAILFKERKTYINEEATKSKFEQVASSATLLHVVAHGYVVKKEPMNSGLIFTKEKGSTNFILKAGELYTMNLNAEIAVLSACHTGDGKIQRGEGIRSLARAFNYAGCSNVTASLWGAPDLSTKKIIILFYQYIKEGDSKDVALQKAKLEYIDNCGFNLEALPCNWSHLVTIGNVSPIEFGL